LASCWDDPDPAIVLGTADAVGAAVIRTVAGRSIGHVRLVVVADPHRRTGLGRAMVETLEDWLACRGADEVQVGGEAPFYLWPGIDIRLTPALCLFEAVGYRERGSVCNLSCPSSFRSEVPAGVAVRRVLTADDAAQVTDVVERTWPWWSAEVARGIEHGACLAAWRGDEVLGLGCHSVSRGGWIGPLATVPAAEGGGIGRAVLGRLCADIAVAGYRRAEIAWVGPIGFYARAADAHVSRVFQSRSRRLR